MTHDHVTTRDTAGVNQHAIQGDDLPLSALVFIGDYCNRIEDAQNFLRLFEIFVVLKQMFASFAVGQRQP